MRARVIRILKGGRILFAYAGVTYAAIASVMGCGAIQRRLLHHPDIYPPETLLANLPPGATLWPSGQPAGEYRGILFQPPLGACEGTVLLFHGNAGSALDRIHYAERLGALGMRLILVEYPGYGARAGSLDEESISEDAAESAQLALEQFGAPLYLFGESLGSGVAAAAWARAGVPVEGLVLVTPWDTLSDLAQSLYWFLPVRLLMRDWYDTISNLRGFPGPLAIVEAEFDEIIPIRHSRRLFDSFDGKKRLWTIEGAGHNTWFWHVGPSFWPELAAYLKGTTGGGRPPHGERAH